LDIAFDPFEGTRLRDKARSVVVNIGGFKRAESRDLSR
jgi:hypothetical protein